MTEDRAAQLRREFDASFQERPKSGRAARVDLLVIGVGGEQYGLRLSEVEGVVRDKKITPLPGAPVSLLGIAGFRGQLVAVHDLAGWLGLEAREAAWLALVAAPGKTRLALAFDALEQQLSLDPSELVAGDSGRHVACLAQTPRGPLPVLSVTSLLEQVGP